MDPEPLSLFPSEAAPPAERQQPLAASVPSGRITKARLRPATETAYALEQQVQFLKARSHVAHALSEGKRAALAVNADDAPAPAEWIADRARIDRTRAREAAFIAMAVLAALACGILLSSIARTPEQQTDLVPTLVTARTVQVTEPAAAPYIPQPDLRDRTAAQTPERVAAQPTASPAPNAIAQAASTHASAVKINFTGELVVDSVPAGATVLINQRPVGTTPLRLTDYPAGSYAVWVERDGYQRWTAGVRVQAKTTTHIRPLLSSKPRQQTANAE